MRDPVLLLRSIVENLPHMIFVKDAVQLRFVLVNKAGEGLLGYRRQDLIGRNDHDFFTPAEADFFTRKDREVLDHGILLDIPEEPIHTRALGVRILHTKKIPILDRAGRSRYLLGISEDITERKQLEREVLEISEREQRRIGQELHDGLGQHLAGIAFLAQALAGALESRKAPEAADAAKVAASVGQVISRTRDIARLLYPVALESQGLASALRELAANTRQVFNVACEVTCDRSVPPQERIVEGNLFRIAQEAVANAVRHGRARRITIDLTDDADRLTLAVSDDGRGFPKTLPAGNGMGMAIMKHRAATIDAAIVFGRSDLGGALVSCAVPRPAARSHP